MFFYGRPIIEAFVFLTIDINKGVSIIHRHFLSFFIDVIYIYISIYLEHGVKNENEEFKILVCDNINLIS